MGNMFDRAKDIFLENRGCQDLMLDNGCLEEYSQFKVSKEMEYTWKDEYIKDQFNKASSQNVRFIDLVCGVCLMAGYYGNQTDYQKIFSIRHLYLNGLGMIEYIMYFDKVLDSIRIMLRNNEMTRESKVEIVSEFEKMLTEVIEGKDNIEDNAYNFITQKYCLGTKENYNITKLNKIYNEVKRIKEFLLKFA